MKTCSKCGESKPLDGGFHRDKSKRDGRETRCKTCRLAQQAEHRAHPDVKARVAEYDAEYYAVNREALLERKAEHHAAHPHVSWVKGYQRRAKRYGFEPVVEPFTKDELIARWGDACWHCGGPFEQLDHAVVPVALGGHHTLENCRPSCAPCNRAGTNVRRTNTTTEMSN